MKARALLLLCSALALACSTQGTLGLQALVEFQAQGDDDTAQAGVDVVVNGVALGKTDATGQLHARVEGIVGAGVDWDATCPAPLTGTRASGRISLLPFDPLDGKRGSRRLVVSVVCHRPEHTVAVVVKATQVQRDGALAPLAGLPVLVKGRPQGQTDAAGTLHMDLLLPPEDTVEVVADTTATHLAALQPRNPSVTLSGALQDEIHLVDMRFAPSQPMQTKRKPTRTMPSPRAIRVYEHGEGDSLVKLGKAGKTRSRQTGNLATGNHR